MAEIRDHSARVKEEVRRLAGRGVEAGAIFLKARIKETLSTPVPRRRVKRRIRGASVLTYVAATPATPGAPPRKLSGQLRASVDYIMLSDQRALVGVGKVYGRRHELGTHPFLVPTTQRYWPALASIMGRAMGG
jgi:hypothetical protein